MPNNTTGRGVSSDLVPHVGEGIPNITTASVHDYKGGTKDMGAKWTTRRREEGKHNEYKAHENKNEKCKDEGKTHEERGHTTSEVSALDQDRWHRQEGQGATPNEGRR